MSFNVSQKIGKIPGQQTLSSSGIIVFEHLKTDGSGKDNANQIHNSNSTAGLKNT